ncbi:hypothetical protein GCM10023213_47700 [Prosthecobacter algae]|uniref:Flagellar hook-associated protein 1 n=1 Tax=Prosthecobacter algae TaxID=1144682 RepID=A0ABP9PP85_9BACT
MAAINFKTQTLADLYATGTTNGNQGHLDYFRNNANDAIKNEILALDQRIANFQNVITDGAKVGNEDFPYDKEYLKREFMEEVLAIMLKRSEYRAITVPAGFFYSEATYSGGGQDLLRNGPQTTSLGTIWDGNNFSNMTTPEQHKAVLKAGAGEGGHIVYDAYSAWIDAVFAEGNKMKNNPSETVNVVTSISERTLPTANSPNVVYDRVATQKTGQVDANGNPIFRYFLIAKGAPVSDINKITVAGTLNGQAVDAKVSTTGNGNTNSIYIEVDQNLQPLVNNAYGFEYNTVNLSPSMYLYYFTEARIRILRGQLNMKEAVTSEIRDDLAKANSAYADLEAQAGKTRAQSADGKTVNPDLSFETQNMDFFEATNAKKGSMLYENNGNDDQQNYSEWGSSRSSLKAYIDRKSTQSQDAMLDYQTTLNRFNQAYEVLSKIQEKMDGLVKSQIRNVA